MSGKIEKAGERREGGPGQPGGGDAPGRPRSPPAPRSRRRSRSRRGCGSCGRCRRCRGPGGPGGAGGAGQGPPRPARLPRGLLTARAGSGAGAGPGAAGDALRVPPGAAPAVPGRCLARALCLRRVFLFPRCLPLFPPSSFILFFCVLAPVPSLPCSRASAQPGAAALWGLRAMMNFNFSQLSSPGVCAG